MSDISCDRCIWQEDGYCTQWDCEPMTRSEARERLEERKIGKWISMMGHSICNMCGYKGSPILTHYCPNCGASMEGNG